MECRILVTGSNGLLGQKISNQLIKKGVRYIATSKGINRNSFVQESDYLSTDITKPNDIKEIIESFQPTHLIHSAAITNVDYCELNSNECAEVNVRAVKNIFEICKVNNIHFQLLSTDFVFDGKKGNYSEDDERNPLSIYAKSKFDAENILMNSNYENWSIVRTIILYGQGENLSRGNLISWAKKSLQQSKKMKVIDDQFRAPTWADDLAWACIRICELNEKGIYHISGPETHSIYEIVKIVADYHGYSMEFVQKVDSQTLNQPAKRPPKTGFNLEKAKTKLGYNPLKLEQTLAFI